MAFREFWLSAILLFASQFTSSVAVRSYKVGDRIEVFVNKAGPYFNPQETYPYYNLPVCKPDRIKYKSPNFEEVMNGDRMAYSEYQVEFGVDKESQELCTVNVGEKGLEKFRDAVEELYYFDMVADNVTIKNFLGRFVENSIFKVPRTHQLSLYNHITFHFTYNEDKIISANISTIEDPPLDLSWSTAVNITFSYSVIWHEVDYDPNDRSNFYKSNFFPKKLGIHWFSVLNSVVIATIFVGCIGIILWKVLRKDFFHYGTLQNLKPNEFTDSDSGWKAIHGHVFRFPPHKSVFCAVLGVGSQFLALGPVTLVLALLGVYQHQPASSCFLAYTCSSCIAGFVSGSYHRKFECENLGLTLFLASVIFNVPFVVIWSVINSVHWVYGTTKALPVVTVVLLVLAGLLIGAAFIINGGYIGKNRSRGFNAPCHTESVIREIPRKRWSCATFARMVFGGFLPFCVMSVELYYVFNTIWSREIYGIYLLMFAIVLLTSACVAVALTYFQLRAEDYRWWWHSIVRVGSTGFFVFFYSIFFYFKRSNMFGVVQGVEYFGYSILYSFVCFLMFGSLSFFVSEKFVRKIYKKLEICDDRNAEPVSESLTSNPSI